MGDTWFVYGFLPGCTFAHLAYTIGHLPTSSLSSSSLPDKYPSKFRSGTSSRCAETYRSAWRKQGEGGKTCGDNLHLFERDPLLNNSETGTDGWEDFDILTFYFCGRLAPYVSWYASLSKHITRNCTVNNFPNSNGIPSPFPQVSRSIYRSPSYISAETVPECIPRTPR